VCTHTHTEYLKTFQNQAQGCLRSWISIERRRRNPVPEEEEEEEEEEKEEEEEDWGQGEEEEEEDLELCVQGGGVGEEEIRFRGMPAEVGMEENVYPLSHTLLLLMREM
jgi:NACalpha-BTF3-like transcription factor